MERTNKPLDVKKAPPLMRRSMLWDRWSIASLSAVIAVVCLTNPSSAHAIVATASPFAATPYSSTQALAKTTVNTYHPPDNGGPGKTGGSGTRWQ